MSILSQLIAAIYAAPPPGPSGSQTFSYLGSVESFTVPTGVTSLNINMWGAGGAAGGNGAGADSRGGPGGFLKFTTAVTPGEILSAQVGEGGNKTAFTGQHRRPGTGGGMTSIVRGDPFYNDVSLLLHMNGTNGSTTFTDTSLYAAPVSNNGTSAAISTTESKWDGSSLSIAANGYLRTPDSSVYDLTGDFTVEAWVYFNSASDQVGLLGGDSSGNLDFCFLSNQMVIGRINVSFDYGANFSRSAGVWYHVAWSRQNGRLRLFVDGVNIGSVDNNIGYVVTSSHLIIGASTSSDRRFNGYINDLRITNGTARYVTAFTPPTTSFPDPQDQYYDNNSLLLHLNGTDGSTTFTDNSSTPKTLTAVGSATITTSIKKFGTGSLSVPSSSDGITTSGLNLDTNFTIEGWVKPAISGSEKFMIVQGINLTNGFLISLTTSEIRWRSNGTTDISAAISESDWYHFAIVRNGSATNNVKVYVDGVQVVQGTYTNTIESAAGNLNIGACGAISSGFASYGYIDEFRITNGVARYTAEFNPPNREFANSNGIIGIVGAGAGGGGYGSNNTNSWGGAGGDTTANAGGAASVFATGGGAGTPTAGGAVGTPGVGLAGSYLQGGAGAGYDLGTQITGGWPNGGNAVDIDERGGGGGGGYYGGGGGGGQGTWGAGGGGGSSYTGAGVSAITHAKAAANTVAAPGNTETGYVAGVAEGGQNFNDGGNGLIYISW